MKRLVTAVILLCAMIFSQGALAIETMRDDVIAVEVPSAVLMEKTTGSIIYEKNCHERLSPASVTKVMTMLLVIEEIEKGSLKEDDLVTTSARAASMGGSQIFLKEGEQMTVSDMFKSVCVSSANDCAVALAEHISGTEEAFVARMNARAAELGMVDTHFTNCSGLLENDAHLTSAYDIALMSRELITHDKVKEYTTIWMDTVRNGEFGLSNTNKLIFYYEGSTGLKTGFTQKAMYCLSATAERGGVEYIAVVMKGETSDKRFESAKMLLNYAFANYSLHSLRPSDPLPPVRVLLGQVSSVQPVFDGPETLLLEKNSAQDLSFEVELVEAAEAPVEKGQMLGFLNVSSETGLVSKIPIVAAESVSRMSTWEIFKSLLSMSAVE